VLSVVYSVVLAVEKENANYLGGVVIFGFWAYLALNAEA